MAEVQFPGGMLLGGGRRAVGRRRKVLSSHLLVRERAEAVAEAHCSVLSSLLCLILSHSQTTRVWPALALRLGTF